MTVPFLDEAAVRRLQPSWPEMLGALKDAFARRGRGEVGVTPKVGAAGDHAGFFHAMPQVLGDLAIVKWVTSGAQPRGAYIHAHLIASDAIGGAPIAIMDFAWLTGLRTAAVSALAADLLAAPEASTLAIFGCGLQARTHVEALRAVRPIAKVLAVSRDRAGAERFAEEVRAQGIEAEAHDAVSPTFHESDIVLSANALHVTPVLDARFLKPGALMIAVDLAHAWIPESLAAIDAFVTDDAPHFKGMPGAHGPVQSAEFRADLSSLLCDPNRLAWSPSQRVAFVPPGCALSDAAIAGLVIAKARLKPIA